MTTCLIRVLLKLASFAFTISLVPSISWSMPDQTNKYESGKRIEEAAFIKLGGLEQWVTLRGDNDTAPVLLLLHGGPGDVQSPFVDIYKAYEADFILVQWDQRGSGRTYGKYKDQTPDLTLDQLTNDGIELAAHLRKRFKRDGIIVLGHSWGTAIATEMVKKRPDLFLAYVGTGQIASWAESVQWQFDYLKRKASDTNNEAMLNELMKIGTPDPGNTTQYFGFTRPLRKYLNSADSAWLSGLREFVKGLPPSELDEIAGGMNFSGRTLLPFQVQEKLSTTSLNFAVPYYVIQGREDLFTPTDPVINYFKQVKAPAKELIILEHAGHFALVTHKQEFIRGLHRVLSLLKN
jgi:pimeloyl-ACP methyl ester carboxylesterase